MKNGDLERYPPTTDRSLRATSAADELLLEWYRENLPVTDTPLIQHDRFGVLAAGVGGTCRFVATFHSQEEALRRNLRGAPPQLLTPVDRPMAPLRALLRVPKSLELFEVYLRQLAATAGADTRLAAGFMTRHFTPRLLEIAGRYAATVTQSRARKKARLLLLSDFRKEGVAGPQVPGKSLAFGSREYRQYYGVFSGNHIDHATRFLLEAWAAYPELSELTPRTITDLASGNGIIGGELQRHYPEAKLIAIDDSVLAVESARGNLPDADVRYDHTLDSLADNSQELVVTNPPFHFGYENNIEVSLGLFRQAARVLAPGGHLVIVANRHLNYATHLERLYPEVRVVAGTDKYEILRCGGQPKVL